MGWRGNGVGFYCDNNAWNYPFYRREIVGKGYQDLLRDVMLPNARQLLGRNFYFLEDNDPKHGGPRGSVVVKNFIRTNSIRRMNFSPQSPDLNPIENFGIS